MLCWGFKAGRKDIYRGTFRGVGGQTIKGYKWKDTKALMEYGLQKYEYENVFQKQDSSCIIVENGIPESDDIFDVAMAETKIKTDTQELPFY